MLCYLLGQLIAVDSLNFDLGWLNEYQRILLLDGCWLSPSDHVDLTWEVSWDGKSTTIFSPTDCLHFELKLVNLI
jgi:hypothetical protein